MEMEIQKTELREIGLRRELSEKLQLAVELKLQSQVNLIEARIRQMDFEQKNTYPEVTEEQARDQMCEPYYDEHNVVEERYCKNWFHRHIYHEHVVRTEQVKAYRFMLWKESLRECDEILPLSVLLKFKEAETKRSFNNFQVWRPVDRKTYTRKMDPWLVGTVNGKFYKIADWR